MNEQLLRRVCNTPGIPGFEDPIQDVVAETLAPRCDEVRRDRMGNVIGLRKATGPPADGRPLRVMLAAHADEVGMMVRHIDDDGFIRFEPMGGLQVMAIISQHVIIHGREPLRGVIAPTNTPSKKKDEPPEVKDLLIDVGLPADEVRRRVQVGDIVTFAQELVKLNERVWSGRNFDDRLGTYCLLEAMNRVGETAVDAYAVSTVQEENGVRGAPVATFAIEPDIGLAIDGSVTWGPHIKKHEWICALGGGAGVYLMDRLTVGQPRLVRFLFELAERRGIRCQRNIGGGTDAKAIQRTGRGALATTVGAPTRYMHSTVQLAHADDIDATADLLVAFLEHAHELEPVPQ